MKKLLTTTLALFLAFGMAVTPVFAADYDPDTDNVTVAEEDIVNYAFDAVGIIDLSSLAKPFEMSVPANLNWYVDLETNQVVSPNYKFENLNDQMTVKVTNVSTNLDHGKFNTSSSALMSLGQNTNIKPAGDFASSKFFLNSPLGGVSTDNPYTESIEYGTPWIWNWTGETTVDLSTIAPVTYEIPTKVLMTFSYESVFD